MAGWYWRAGVLGAAALCLLGRWPAGAVDQYYSNRVYPALQQFMTPASNLLPVAVFDVAIIGAVLLVLAAPLRAWRAGKGKRLRAMGRLAVDGPVTAAALYLVFFAMWGLNYHRAPVTAGLDFDERRLTAAAVEALAVRALDEMRVAAEPVQGEWPDRSWEEVAAALGPHVDAWGASLGHAAVVIPGRPKWTLLDPYFTRAGVSGMTDPIFLETLVASDLLPFERPAVVAHEWAHLAGWARESEASFAGFLLCMRAGGEARYSGWFALFMHLASEMHEGAWARVRTHLSPRVDRDWRAVVDRNRRNRRPQFSMIAWRAYDSYLKSNRVTTGVQNYGEVVRLVVGTRFDDQWRPARMR